MINNILNALTKEQLIKRSKIQLNVFKDHIYFDESGKKFDVINS